MRGLNRTQLKLIAICAMVCDHVAWGFVEFMSPLGQVMHVIGRLTIPIMCFFVAEGFRKTSNVKGYVTRMATFAEWKQCQTFSGLQNHCRWGLQP